MDSTALLCGPWLLDRMAALLDGGPGAGPGGSHPGRA